MNDKIVPEKIIFKTAATAEDFDHARSLFRQYAQSLDFDLEFQHFDKELETIDQLYYQPSGALLLAFKDKKAVGCVAVRRLEEEIAELKRLFIQPAFRRYKIGKQLLNSIIDIAQALDYKFIRLDTLPTMKEAINLYRSFGFYEIDAYCFNPMEDAVFMEKKL